MGDGPVSLDTEDSSHGLGGGGVLVVGDLINRNIESGFCDRNFDCMMTCLPGAEIVEITHSLDRLLVLGRNQQSCMKACMKAPMTEGNVGGKFRSLGRILKARTSSVASSEVLLVPYTGSARKT